MRNILSKLINNIGLWLMRYRCLRAKNLANRLHSIDGKRYVVVKMGQKYLVMNNNDRKAINRKVKPSQRITFAQLLENKVYSTK